MRRSALLACGLSVLLATWLAPVAPAAAATTEEVLAKLTKIGTDTKTFEADIKVTMKGGQAGNMTGHMAWQAVISDNTLSGKLMNTKQKMTVPGMAEMSSLVVCDGEFMWIESHSPQGVVVMKQKPDFSKLQTGDGQNFRDKYDLKLVGEEEFDGQNMWMLEGAPKQKAAESPAAGMGPQAQDPGKVRIYVGQKDLLCHRFRNFDKAGNEMSDTQMTNIKLNGKLDPSLFKYTPPEGARVMDMTKGMPDMREMMKNLPKGGGAGGE